MNLLAGCKDNIYNMRTSQSKIYNMKHNRLPLLDIFLYLKIPTTRIIYIVYLKVYRIRYFLYII